MKKLLTAAAAAAMMFGASAGYAQDPQLYVTSDGDTMMVMGGDNAEGAKVVGDDTYAMPSDCPEGAYFRSGENQLTACGEGGASFELAAPDAGAMTSTGDAFPAGSMLLNKSDDETGNEPSGSGTSGSGG
jgi:hypothetical protein